MAKYKVKVLEIQGINKNIYKAGQIVTDGNFPEGNAEKLAKEGKLELLKLTPADAKRAKAEAEKKAKEAKAEAEKALKNAEDNLVKIEEELTEASEETKDALQKSLEDAQLAVEIAKENLDKLEE